MFSYLSPEQRVPQDHPLRAVRVIVDQSLTERDGHFSRIYSDLGRPSLPPEHLLRALLLQVFYSIRSERQLMEQMDYNLLFRCSAVPLFRCSAGSWVWGWMLRSGYPRFCPESAGPECDLPCGTQAEGIGHRRPYYPSCGLRDEHSHAPAHRVHLWLDEDRGWDAENPIPWLGAGQPALLHRGRRLQSGTYGSTGSGLMGVLRPEFRKWPGKAVKTATRHRETTSRRIWRQDSSVISPNRSKLMNSCTRWTRR